jgi:hypothetical protein
LLEIKNNIITFNNKEISNELLCIILKDEADLMGGSEFKIIVKRTKK